MAYSGLSLICCLLTQMKEKCHFFAHCHTDIQWGGGGGTQQSFMLGGPTLRSKPIPFFIQPWGQKEISGRWSLCLTSHLHRLASEHFTSLFLAIYLRCYGI